MELQGDSERTARTSGTPVYFIDYILENNYGKKRILTCCAVVDKKLYILNAQTYLTGDAGVDAARVEALRGVADSFDLL